MRKLFYLLLLLSLSSCFSNKRLVYIQDETFSTATAKLVEHNKPTYQLQPNDILSINVSSPDPKAVAFLNNNVGGNMQGGVNSPAFFYMNGYSVDSEGYIEIPVVGRLMVKNMSVNEAKQLVENSVNNYINNAMVSVKLVSFKISVLGAINRPGHHFVYNGQANIFEGLSMAGDLTNNGNRENIKLIRQTTEGSEVILLDLTDPNLIESPYYYLQPNDVIYVEPSKESTKRINIEVLTVVFSGITTLVLLFNTFSNY